MNDREPDNPGVITKPPLIYLAFLFLGFALDYVWRRDFSRRASGTQPGARPS